MSRNFSPSSPQFVDRFVNGVYALLDQQRMVHVFTAGTRKEYDAKVSQWLARGGDRPTFRNNRKGA